MDVVSEMGCSSKSHQEAHKVNSPIKVSSNNPISPQKPNPITKPTQQKGKPKLKRIARERGSQAHSEQQANLSGSKRPGKLVFSDDFDEAQPLKKLCEMFPKNLNHPLHYRRWLPSSTAGHNECFMLELPGNWEPPDSLHAARSSAAMDSLFSLPSRDQSKTKSYGKNKILSGFLQWPHCS